MRLVFLPAICFIVFLITTANAVVVSEIMHNPEGGDSSREWIEIYNNDNIVYNITGWKLNTDGVDHILNEPPKNGGKGGMLLEPGNYAVIAQDAGAFLAEYDSENVIDSSWKDLSNSAGETIMLKNATHIFDNTTYTAATEGSTSCLMDGSFTECKPTPGKENTRSAPDVPDDGEEGDAPQCDVRMEITAVDAYDVGETIDFEIMLNNSACISTNASIHYYIEDLYGSVVSPAVDTTTQLSCFMKLNRQWTPQSSGTYRIVASAKAECDQDSSNATKLVAVLPEPVEEFATATQTEPQTEQQPKQPARQISAEIVDYNRTIFSGEEFTTKIRINNTMDAPEYVTIYSYVSSGSSLVSTGYANGKWLSTYTANSKIIEIQANSSAEVELRNAVKDVTPGLYSLRVKVKYGSREKTLEHIVNISELSEPVINVSVDPVEESRDDAKVPVATATGHATEKGIDLAGITEFIRDAIGTVIRAGQFVLSAILGMIR